MKRNSMRTLLVGALLSLLAIPASCQSLPAMGICRPVTERTTEVGCWVLADTPVGRLAKPQVYWYLYAFPTRSAAERARGQTGTVLESLGRIWLLTVEKKGWHPSGKGERVAEIGPLPVVLGTEYSALYAEAIFTPGMKSHVHIHPGPEAWFTVAGESCLETPKGKLVGRVGGPPVIVPGGTPMQLTATGTQQRRALVLLLHDSSKAPTMDFHDWAPKGLCGP